MPELTPEQIEDLLSRGDYAAKEIGIPREEAEAVRKSHTNKST